ncbi:hypothetical protein [Flavobacterium beibuense]|uniref:Uncharacterized protein n=1 Tax=Flavobacterium beibuense TaxID=657326 RepID=A0A444WES0_9FLAO|nr:hypothetical protein [Flavobacterium beibuense]RYJ44266.1 hypothetical protein NU09_0876 [Flavobacterium beibuense]
MDKGIRLKIRKELTTEQEKKVIQLKGTLISGTYTDIIHISDEGEDFYINHFVTTSEKKQQALEFITLYLKEKELESILWIL